MASLKTSFLAGLCVIAAGIYATGPASSQDTRSDSTAPNGPKTLTDVSKGPAAPKTAAKSSKPYYIEFRARSALSYGHAFTVIARSGAKITQANVVGFHPISESPVPWMIGHVVPVIAEKGFSDGDIEDAYITARWRVYLTEAEHKKLMAEVDKLKGSSILWHAAVYNCNAFVGDIAKMLGFKTPGNTWQYPKEYITELKKLNNGVKQPPKQTTANLAPMSIPQ